MYREGTTQMSESIDLQVQGLDSYRASLVPITAYRANVTLIELDSEGEQTGRKWTEPYDIIRCDISELEHRFERRIGQPVISSTEEVLERYSGEALSSEMAKCGSRMLRELLKPLLQGALHRVVYSTKERVELIKQGATVLPEQVVSEAAINHLLERTLAVIEPVVARLLREAGEAQLGSSIWQRVRRLFGRGKRNVS